MVKNKPIFDDYEDYNDFNEDSLSLKPLGKNNKQANFDDNNDSFSQNNYKKNNKKTDFFQEGDEDGYELNGDEIFNAETLGKSIPKSDKEEVYKQTIVSGIMWFIMFAVSLVVLFYIFNTPYYLYYNNKEPITLEANKPIFDNKSVFNNDNKLSFNQEIQQPLDDNVLNNAEENNLDENLDLNPLDPNVDEPNNANQINTDKNNNSEINDKKTTDSNPNLSLQNKKDKESSNSIQSLLKNENLNVKKDLEAKSLKEKEPKQPEKINKSNNTSDLVWLVNIFSTDKKETLDAQLKQLINTYPVLADGYTFYFTEFKDIQGNVKYRISIAKTSLKFYEEGSDASKLCDMLKQSQISCFIGTVSKKSIYKQ
jgi:hypothetical protein